MRWLRRGWWQTVGAAAFVLLVALGVASCGSPAPHPPMMRDHMGGGRTGTETTPAPGVREIRVDGLDFSFQPERIELEAGQTVNVTFTNQGRVFHDIVVRDADFALAAEPGETVSGALRIDTPGEYAFVCTVSGHAAAGMRGTMSVAAP